MAHTQRDRELIIQNTLREYKNFIGWRCGYLQEQDKVELERVINNMNGVYIMVSRWATSGIVELRQAIFEAEDRLKKLQ